MRFRLRILTTACVLAACFVPVTLFIVFAVNPLLSISSTLAIWLFTGSICWLAHSRYYQYSFVTATVLCMVLLFFNVGFSPVPATTRALFIIAPLLLYSFLWSPLTTFFLTTINIIMAVMISGIITEQPELVPTTISTLMSAAIFSILGAVVREQTFRTLAHRTRQLEISEARLRGAFEGSLDAFYYLTGVRNEHGEVVDFTMSMANDHGFKLLLKPPPQLIGTRVSNILNAMGQPDSINRYIDAVKTGTSYEEEYIPPPNMVRAKWLHMQVVALGDDIALTCRDITARKEAEALLIHREQEFRTLAENLPNQIGRIDRNGNILYMNPPLVAAFEKAGNTDAVKRIEDLPIIPTNMQQQAVEGLARVFDTGEPLRLEFSKMIDGQEQVFSARLVPEKDNQQQVKTALGIVRNITESRRTEAQRVELGIERERMRLLRQFVGDVSHDLMTPLTVIKNSLYLMNRIGLPESMAPFTSQINTQSAHLEKMIRDMLLLSQLDDAGREDFHFMMTDLDTFVGSFIREHQALVAQNNQRLHFEANGTPIKLPIDQDKLWRVLTNLVHNAVKYTPEGGTITVSIQQAEPTMVGIDIRDTGPGIPASDLPHIFERFFKGEAHRPNEGGSGLGLSIAQRIVEAHRGKLSVESEMGVGTTFHILLPITMPDAVQA
jgi:PAS domain S-box-containing protein